MQIGAGVAAFLILMAGIVVSLKTKHGTLIVEVDQPDATVQVLDSEGKVEVSQLGGGGKVTVSIDPGRHRLKVVKDGFTTYGQEFEMEKNGKLAITAKLVSVNEKPVVAPARKPFAYETPGFDEWVKNVQAMPVEKQVEAVSKKLVELNPGFDGVLGASYSDDVVTVVGFDTDHVTDISPFRALVGLQLLHGTGSMPPQSPRCGQIVRPIADQRHGVAQVGGRKKSGCYRPIASCWNAIKRIGVQ